MLPGSEPLLSSSASTATGWRRYCCCFWPAAAATAGAGAPVAAVADDESPRALADHSQVAKGASGESMRGIMQKTYIKRWNNLSAVLQKKKPTCFTSVDPNVTDALNCVNAIKRFLADTSFTDIAALKEKFGMLKESMGSSLAAAQKVPEFLEQYNYLSVYIDALNADTAPALTAR